MSGKMILVSSCLAGIPCRYDGKAQPNKLICVLAEKGLACPVCPECLGGLSTPRISAEIVGGNGEDVLAGRAKVMAKNGDEYIDVSAAFIKGAYLALQAARSADADTAVLKANSPSCGYETIYDGTFSGGKREGSGVTAALLKANGIKVISL